MKRRVRSLRVDEEHFDLYVGHRPLQWTLFLWPALVIVVLWALSVLDSQFLSTVVIAILIVATCFWLREHFGGDSLIISGGEISVKRGFGVVKTTSTFRLSDIESVAFYPISRNPLGEPKSCIGILARQWVMPLVIASSIEEDEAVEILRQMKSMPGLTSKVHLGKPPEGRPGITV